MDNFDCLRDCPELGYCCREFRLLFSGQLVGFRKFNLTKEQADMLLEGKNLPYEALRYDHYYESWFFTCSKLGEDGRCTIYNNRPDICRKFKPKSDSKLCCAKKTFSEVCIELLTIIRKIVAMAR